MAAVAKQSKTTRVTITHVLRAKSFRLGFETAQRGEPWPAEYDRMPAKDQWRFERGRQLGLLYPTMALKRGATVTREAQIAFAAAYRDKHII